MKIDYITILTPDTYTLVGFTDENGKQMKAIADYKGNKLTMDDMMVAINRRIEQEKENVG